MSPHHDDSHFKITRVKGFQKLLNQWRIHMLLVCILRSENLNHQKTLSIICGWTNPEFFLPGVFSKAFEPEILNHGLIILKGRLRPGYGSPLHKTFLNFDMCKLIRKTIHPFHETGLNTIFQAQLNKSSYRRSLTTLPEHINLPLNFGSVTATKNTQKNEGSSEWASHSFWEKIHFLI